MATTAAQQTPRKIPPFPPEFVKGICDVLAQTDFPGLTGSEIDSLLQMVRVRQREPAGNKRESLYITLYNVQVHQQAGNVVSAFIARAISPGRYAAQPARFTDLRDQLNEFLVFYGYAISDAGLLSHWKEGRQHRRRIRTCRTAPDRTQAPRMPHRTTPILRRRTHQSLPVPRHVGGVEEHPSTRAQHHGPRG